MGILGDAMRAQVEVLSSSLTRVGWRSFWCQLFLSSASYLTLWLSFLMQMGGAPSAGWPRLAALRGAFGEGLLLSGASLCLSAVHAAWALSFVRSGGRVTRAAHRTSLDGLGPLLDRFAGVRRSLDRAVGVGLAGAVVAAFGVEQVLGNMVARMLLARGLSIEFWMTNPPARLQSLDLFAMQASFLVLASHLVGVLHTHRLRGRVPDS